MDATLPVALIVSASGDATTDYLSEQLSKCGTRHLRLNTDVLETYDIALSAGAGAEISFQARVDNCVFSPADVSTVYVRRPMPPEMAHIRDDRERHWAQNELLSVWGGFLAAVPESAWINHPSATMNASYKAEQLVRADQAGLHVPLSLITSDPAEAARFIAQVPEAVVKPIGHGEVRSGQDDHVALVYTNALSTPWDNDLALIAACPTLIQHRIEKMCDVRITVLDGRCHSVALHSQERRDTAVDCRRDLVNMRYSAWDLPLGIADTVVALVQGYSLRFAAVDMCIAQDGTYWFFEVNPSGQWAWLDEAGVTRIASAFAASLHQDAATWATSKPS